jgi:hypothetical protein
MNDVDRRSPAWVVALVFAVHITLWSVVFLSLIYILPRYHKICYETVKFWSLTPIPFHSLTIRGATRLSHLNLIASLT